MQKYMMAFDAGTTGCRTIIFDKSGKEISSAYQEFSQIYPQPGWVEHDPQEIWNAQYGTALRALNQANIVPEQIEGIGITNQRETCVVWDKMTGKPIMNALVWQDRRTADICEELKAQGHEEYIKENTGLIVDAYFSGTKIAWILDNVEGARERAEKGELLCGTIDSWLIWNLSEGAVHVIDYSNASRTQLLNIKEIKWDDHLLEIINVPKQILPQAMPSSSVYGVTGKNIFNGAEIKIAASVGDQQGALFGQACFDAGMVKATYGTGGSLIMNTGEKSIKSKNGLLTTIAWGLDGQVEYALEGLLYVVGASVQWLRDEMHLVYDSCDTEYLAGKVEDTHGAYFIPAFTGLSAPYWDQNARGAIIGLTRGVNRNHIIRATLESMAYQIKDVVKCMESDSGIKNVALKVDGGACKNNFVMQFQADLLDIPVMRPKVVETTARGAAFLAGLAVGFWKNKEELLDTFELDAEFLPQMTEETREKLYDGWKKAVSCVLTK